MRPFEHGNSRAKQIAVASVPEVIQKGIKIGFEKNWQNRGYDTYVFAAPVKINGAKLYEGVIVRKYILQNGMKNFYVHEVCWTDGSYVMLDSNGNVTKKKILPHCSRRQCGATLRMPRKYLLKQV